MSQSHARTAIRAAALSPITLFVSLVLVATLFGGVPSDTTDDAADSAPATVQVELASSFSTSPVLAQVTARVYNRFEHVYRCSRFNRNCRFQYTYQTNPPVNPRFPSSYFRVNRYCWCWV